ncbi:MAG: phospho-N-acetylmuramoyl-pentapeptide-transferase [Flavobacteriales bacterium]|nr:phospho-N-acetylmuramoyl-pentapeptide-transferase [Flavobacteriales bacterium]MBG14839.1 phospho-N-acetylmuramoyl-pentapeptide-transferase [Crocinitomicaceae bacterium]|tara:strand:+ start:3118 stop:4335 length:1218 start_codon:yes stop_codon:yes gene_type:complete
MFYHLFEYIQEITDLSGAGLFQYISFRAGMAIITSLIISMLFGGKLIRLLRKKQVGESIRDLGLDGQVEKAGTPTMGGLIILGAILIPTLLFAKLDNIYTITMVIATVWLGLIGFIDDYIKVFKKNKKGLAGRFKIVGQVGVGIIVGSLLYFSDSVVIKEKVVVDVEQIGEFSDKESSQYKWVESKSTKTTIPFFKNNEFDYSWFGLGKYTWIVFILIVIIIVVNVSNGANLTDGIDGLATGTSAIIGTTLAIFAYLSGNAVFADYLNIMYIPNSGELVVFIGAFVGACIGFLWYNSYPAKVFMGDTGSLALGGIIATFAIAIRKELLIPVICGIFLIENVSVMIQVGYFKYTKRKYGEGKRVFLMAPLHHHYQKKQMHESKIVARFWIVGILLAVLSIVTLKLR